MNIDEIYNLYLKYPLVTTDSRECREGSLFFALKGASFNGNRFAREAIAKGCAYAFVDEEEFADNENIYYVPDVLQTLQQLARKHRKTLNIPVIGITGTNGKTTTKELIAAVLQQRYKVSFTQGNLNNHIGVPLTLLKLTKEDEIAIVEMGANHQGEIKELAEIALPDYGIITNIGKAHLEGFGSFEGVIKTKGELYDYLRKNDKKIFINTDNEILNEISKGLKKVTYGTGKDCDVKGEIMNSEPFLTFRWKSLEIKTNLIGSYNFENALAAVAVGAYFEVPQRQIVSALEGYVPQNSRSQYKDTGKNKLIIDAYNANPTSMKASVGNFIQMSYPRKVAILGDMKELGAQSREEHEQIVDLLSGASLSQVYLIGPCFDEAKKPGFMTFGDVDQFITYLQQHPVEDAMILIKGSNSMRLIKTVEYL